MDLDRKEIIYLERAKSELELARVVFEISSKDSLKESLELKNDATFFSNVISSCYYCIFYSAKAILKLKDVETRPPEEHKKTLEEFEKLVKSGEIDEELLGIYEDIVIKADELLGIFKKEKSKRGKFTYRKFPQTNLEPARESLENAKRFFKNINLVIKSGNAKHDE